MKRIWWALFTFTMATNLITPLFSLYQQRFGVNTAELSLVFATYAVFLLPRLLLSGSLSDHLGRKRVLMSSLALMLFAVGILAWSPTPLWLFVGRALQGVATGVFSAPVPPISWIYPPRHSARTFCLWAVLHSMIGFSLGSA